MSVECVIESPQQVLIHLHIHMNDERGVYHGENENEIYE